MKPLTPVSITLKKCVILCSVVFITLIIYQQANLSNSLKEYHAYFIPNKHESHIEQMKHVLIWTDNSTYPFKLLHSGRRAFLEAGCDVTACYVTSDRSYLRDYTSFDAVLFHGPELSRGAWDRPERRALHQKYIYASVESAGNYPICDPTMEGFFNWTWTYKLTSDVSWKCITVRNLNGDPVGPSADTVWMPNMQPINEELKKRFSKRRKAAAWFVSNCNSKSAREQYFHILQKHLRAYGWDVDVFGTCGLRRCPRFNRTKQDCEDMLRKDYYFYLAFENSFNEDYVSKKVLHGYSNYVVPVVFGSANYTRFLPPSSYLNAFELSPKVLAEIINQTISMPEAYHEYFRWTNHYRVEASEARPDTNQFCRLCSALHDPIRMGQVTVRSDFRRWWNGPTSRQICFMKERFDNPY